MPDRTADAAPLSGDEFDRLMATIGGFEPVPRLAVAVSGGADSIALALLAQRWASERGGRLLALTVDHGLRAESAREAAETRRQLAGRGIDHEILHWHGQKPVSGVEAAARKARYALLLARAERDGILHLLTAHHADDQAETILLRLSRGSGPDGLAGMPAVTYLAPLRLVRPLLAIPRARLRATCRAEGLCWAEDPTNTSPALARGRLRRVAPLLAAEGLTAGALVKVTVQAGVQRRHLERETAALLAASVTLSPFGFARIRVADWHHAGELLALRALARVIVTVGGLDYPPAGEALATAWVQLRVGERREVNLGGCRIVADAASDAGSDGEPGGAGWLICRDGGLIGESSPLIPGQSFHWDRRYWICRNDTLAGDYRVAALGRSGWKALCRSDAWLSRQNIPGPARAALPALWLGNTLIEIADFGLRPPREAGSGRLAARFIPSQPMAGHAFTVVSPASHIIYCP